MKKRKRRRGEETERDADGYKEGRRRLRKDMRRETPGQLIFNSILWYKAPYLASTLAGRRDA